MKNISKKMNLLMDFKAAFWAGIVAGIIFYLLNIYLVPILLGGNMWVIIRLFASIVLGEVVLAPPSNFSAEALLVSFIINFVLSIAFTFLIAFVFHKWGLVVGIIGGAIFGLGIYLVNFYSLSYFFPWFFALSSWPFVITHILFGAFAGGIYELLEVEKYENID
jgi:hypothetical protein